VRPVHDRGHVVGDDDLEHPAEERPRRLAPADHRVQVLAERQVHENVPGIHGGEDQRMHDAAVPGLRVEQQAHLPEVDLALGARLAVSHRHRPARPGTAMAQHLQRIPVQRALGHHHALAGQQLAGLHHRQPLPGHHVCELLVMGGQQRPRLPVPVPPVRPDPLGDQA
jgi:hypothetical protein